jgi:hypothetical protein
VDTNDNSLKDWEDILNKFRYLFRNEKSLIQSGRLTESEILEDFLFAVLEACEKMSEME